MDTIVRLIGLLLWVAGIVLAKGFWSTLFAIIIPPWALYLVIEKALMIIGWIT